MKLATAIAAVLSTIGLASPGTALADSSDFTYWTACMISEISNMPNRVHVRCSNVPDGVFPFYAVPTSSSAEATRFVMLASQARASGKPLHIQWKSYSEDNQAAWGCAYSDCRRATTFLVQ